MAESSAARERFLLRNDGLSGFDVGVCMRVWTSLAEIVCYLQSKVAFVSNPGKTYIVKTGSGDETVFLLQSQEALTSHLNKFVFEYMDGNAGRNGNPTKAVFRGTKYTASSNCTVFDGVVFEPTGEANPRFFNIYQGTEFVKNPDLVIDNGKIDLFVNHVRQVMANGNEGHGMWLLQWMAHIIQYPDSKPVCACVFRGLQGTGKSMCWEIFGRLLGAKLYVSFDSLQRITGKFNVLAANRQLIVVDEVSAGDDYVGCNRLKALITASHMTIEKKFADPITTSSYEGYVLLSNHPRPVRVESSDRRFACFDVSATRRNDLEYFERLTTFYKDRDALNHLYQFFARFTVGGVPVPRVMIPLDSDLRQELQYHARDEIVNFLLDVANKDDSVLRLYGEGEFFQSKDLYEEFKAWVRFMGFEGKVVNFRYLGNILSKSGLVDIKMRGRRGYLWNSQTIKLLRSNY